MNRVPTPTLSSPAFRPTESQFSDLLRESADSIDPTTGRVLWSVTAEDVLDLEIPLYDELMGDCALCLGLEVSA